MGKMLNSALIALAITAATAAPATAADVRLDLANEYGASSFVALADKDFVDTVAEKSNGSIDITAHFGGALGFKSKDQFDAVGSGIVPIAGSYAGAFVGINPLFALSSMPFLTPTVDDAKRLFEIARPDYERIFEKNNQKLLYASPYTPVGIWAKIPVKSVEDLEQLKLRTYDAAGTETFKAAGASPLQVSWADVVPLLSAGGINAVLTSDEIGISASFWDYMQNFNALPYSIAVNMTHMNLDAFDALSPEQQQIILDAAAEVQERNWGRVDDRVKRNKGILTEHNVTVVPADPALVADLQEASKSVIDGWLAQTGEVGQAILDEYRK
ncbi:TRAP transporter substrate-binding protein [Amorphus sp. 3PC139-8]|uniref:TRAP transporter substrate-binding protein n=1 Tax=Amorphus sp. 3PC139-8 TaxID=2735676 RepID=UPI00345CEC2C